VKRGIQATLIVLGCTGLIEAAPSKQANDPNKAQSKPRPQAEERVLDIGGDVRLKLVKYTSTAYAQPQKNSRSTGHIEPAPALSRAIWIATDPVSESQWQQIMGRTTGPSKGQNAIVRDRTARDCTTFCKRLSESGRQNGTLTQAEEYRLPTETEWRTVMSSDLAATGIVKNNVAGFEWCLTDGSTYPDNPKGTPVAMTASAAGTGRVLAGPPGRFDVQAADGMLGFRIVLAPISKTLKD
jgi:hypothetical protein